MKVKALKAFTLRDGTSGDLTAIAHGEVVTIDDTLGETLISQGLAEEYTLIIPSAAIRIRYPALYDVAKYAQADVDILYWDSEYSSFDEIGSERSSDLFAATDSSKYALWISITGTLYGDDVSFEGFYATISRTSQGTGIRDAIIAFGNSQGYIEIYIGNHYGQENAGWCVELSSLGLIQNGTVIDAMSLVTITDIQFKAYRIAE